jgi:chorismate lyase/3-hydroxybenzoate synthase
LGGFSLADDGLLVFGHGLLDAGPQVDLEQTTRDAYAQLLDCCAERGAEHLLRVWNVVPAINEPQRGIERYKLFCKGRAEGYLEHFGPERMEGALPASSAVGGATDHLAITFLASRVAGRHVENPRQVSAYRYPPEYGPRSPSFARATVVPSVAGGWVFISGTASIVGHQSRHVGDLTAQLEETIRNVAVLFEAIDGAPCDEVDIARRMVSLRVYLRRGADWPFVSATLRERLGTNVVLMGLAADICRRELLIEIEAVARPR